jgi:hypothetical protein
MKKYRIQLKVFHGVFAFLCFLGWGCASVVPKNDTSQLKYTYSRLKLMDLDQMSQLMLDQAREFKKTDDLNALKEGLLICLARPDEDSVVEKTISTIRTPLEDRNQWESAVNELIDKSVSVIRDTNQSSTDQVTYSLVLENLISELRPDFLKQYKSPGFETRMIEKIAAENTDLLPPANAERKLNLMKGSFSASHVAQKMLDKRKDFLTQEKNKDK